MALHHSLNKIFGHGALHGSLLTPGSGGGGGGCPLKGPTSASLPGLNYLSSALGFLQTHAHVMDRSSGSETACTVCLLMVLSLEGAQ